MKSTLIGLACLTGLGMSAAANAEGAGGGVLLRYHFKPGDEIRYDVTVSGKLDATHSGVTGPDRTGLLITYELTNRVTSVSPSGVAEVSVVMDKVDNTTWEATLRGPFAWALTAGSRR